ncbi:J domain-containing protein [uncultured Winogradskyella sp.]|uniref:J domain-containing protein n=1 Tax=uncultured Winogradskyella sp. TaxID=395353 RepID=UPI0026261167|nr:J domain-containing protein [uncultured Winogradskyella sp.]
MITNYYTLLKVEPSSDINTTKKAFRREIAIYHPDNNTSPEAREQFEKLVEAFDILSNEEKRRDYVEMLKYEATNKPIIIEQKQQYEDWQKEAKTKSKTYEDYGINDLLALDTFNTVDEDIAESIISDADDLVDGLTDELGDIFDLF